MKYERFNVKRCNYFRSCKASSNQPEEPIHNPAPSDLFNHLKVQPFKGSLHHLWYS